MVPPSPKHSAPSTTKNTKNAEAAADQKLQKADPAPVPSDGAKQDTKTIVSITVDGKLARQARLLAKFRGVTISSLFVEAAAREIPVALKAALASIKDEVE